MLTDDPAIGATYFRVVGPGDEADLVGLAGRLDPEYAGTHDLTPSGVEAMATRTGRDVHGMLMTGQGPVAYGAITGFDDGSSVPTLHVAVPADLRRRGYGRRTLEQLEEQARVLGAERVVSHSTVAGSDPRLTVDLDSRDVVAPAAPGRGGRVVKRLVDVVGAATALVLLSPVLAWIAVALVVVQGRPVLFRHRRPGLHGQGFTMVKFRTMRDARPDEIWYLTDDARVTRVGRFLRDTSLDELPELWNVLRGEMSLVGPRPLLVEYLATYTTAEARRHDVRPGITSWAAVNGRHSLRFKERLQLDVWYVDHQSLRLDLRILSMTIKQVLRRSDVETTQDMSAVGFPLPGAGGSPVEDGDRIEGGDDATA